MRILLILFLFFSTKAYTNEQSVHNTAHFGAAYAITTVGYGLSRKAFRWDSADSLVFSVFTVLAFSTAQELIDAQESRGGLNNNALLFNVMGSFGAAATIIMFDF